MTFTSNVEFLISVQLELGLILKDLIKEKPSLSSWFFVSSQPKQVKFIEKILLVINQQIQTNELNEQQTRQFLKKLRLENRKIASNEDLFQNRINAALKYFNKNESRPLSYFRKINYGEYTLNLLGINHEGTVENNQMQPELIEAFHDADLVLMEAMFIHSDSFFSKSTQQYINQAYANIYKNFQLAQGIVKNSKLNNLFKERVKMSYTPDMSTEEYIAQAAIDHGKKIISIEDPKAYIEFLTNYFKCLAEEDEIPNVEEKFSSFKYYSQRKEKKMLLQNSKSYDETIQILNEIGFEKRNQKMVLKTTRNLHHSKNKKVLVVTGYLHLDGIIDLLNKEAVNNKLFFSVENLFENPAERVDIARIRL